MKPDLFSPITLGDLELPNRIVMAPMTRNRAGKGNVPNELNATYYAQRASAALIITEASQVSPQGMGYPATPGIHSAEQVQGWKGVTAAVHNAGGRIFLQLWHVGRISHPTLQPDGALPVAPSAIQPKGNAVTYQGPTPFVTPRALTLEEIPGVVEQYRSAAQNALSAGFDGVEIHGANGYLLDQFLRSGTNQRIDKYGGTVENRARLLLEVTSAVSKVWGAARVGVRLSPNGNFNDMSDSNPGETFGYVATELSALGLAYLHVIESFGESDPATALPISFFRNLYRGVLMVNGGFTHEKANLVIGIGESDLVSFGTPFISNPNLPERFQKGLALTAADRSTFYGGGEKGYTDYV